MNKREFIEKIIGNFPSSFNKRDMSEVYNDYDIVIDNNLDFDKLYKKFLQEYTNASAPRPAFFKQFESECRLSNSFDPFLNMPKERRGALVTVAKWVESKEYARCLSNHTKAPAHVRELFHKYGMTGPEIDQMRKLGEYENE